MYSFHKIFFEFKKIIQFYFFLLTKAKSTFKDLKTPFPKISIVEKEEKVIKISIYILFGFQFLANNLMER
jgi:hypothetical protein